MMSHNIQYQPNMSLQTPEQKQMGLILHLSQLANLFLFPVGIVVPIVIWQTQKEKIPALDAHGKMVANFMISMTIYIIASFILLIALIGFVLLPVLFILGIVFPIIGGVKANNGEFWEYPLTIKFLK